jgi:hypothetical protein
VKKEEVKTATAEFMVVCDLNYKNSELHDSKIKMREN